MSCVSDYSSQALLVYQTHYQFKEEHLRRAWFRAGHHAIYLHPISYCELRRVHLFEGGRSCRFG